MSTKSVLTAGKGLFNTHVFLEDVKSVIAKQMGPAAFELADDVKMATVGDGNGVMSQVILVDPSDSPALHPKFILKIVSCIHFQQICEKFKTNGSVHQFTPEMEAAMMRNMEMHAQELHNREVNFYELVRKWDAHGDLMSPKLYFSNKFDDENRIKGFLGLEYNQGSEVRHLYENVKVEELRPVLKSLAFLQVKSLSMTKPEKENIGVFNFEKLFSQMLSETGLNGILDAVRMLDVERFGEKVKKVEGFGIKLVNFEMANGLNKHNGIHQDVLVHGDLWSANILWARVDGTFSVKKIIDYQLIHFGNPAEDLVRLFLTTLSGADRRENWEKLLEQFYDYFNEYLGKKPAPYTLEQLKQSYRCYFVTGGLVALPMFGPLAEIKMNQDGGSANASEHREVLLEKAECLLEDIVKYQSYNC